MEDLVYYVHTLSAVLTHAVSNSIYSSDTLWKYCEMKIKSYYLRIYLSSSSLIFSFASSSFFFISSLSVRFLKKERPYSYTVQL